MANLFENTPLNKMFERIKRLDEGKVFIEIISKDEVEKFIVKLNTDQMRLQFINSEGVPLAEIGGGYSDFTLATGNKKGRFKVDLYDSGDFHGSGRIEQIRPDGFSIIFDPVKDDGTNLFEEWGEEVAGLTFESETKAANFILKFYQEKLLQLLTIG